MIKNKVFSNNLNFYLYTVKIILILSITVSISHTLSTYKIYHSQVNDLNKYTKLQGYFTSNGYNYEEDSKARENTDILVHYGNSIIKIYKTFDEQGKLYVNDANVLEFLSEDYLKIFKLEPEDIFNSPKDNYIVVNPRYFNEFLNVRDEKGDRISQLSNVKPTILVPAKYKNKEKEITEIFIEKFNFLLNYNANYKVPISNNFKIDDLEIVYIESDQEFELLGQKAEGKSVKIINTIIMIDHGQFDSLYYYDLLNKSDLFFQLDDRNDFNMILSEYNLSKLVNVGTLLTPYLDKIHFVEFIMYNSLVFTILFFLTLIFVIYISNYVDVTSNSRKYAIQYIYGYSIMNIFRKHLLIYISLASLCVLALFIQFNVTLYLSLLLLDFLLLIVVYKKRVRKNLNRILKGG